MELHNLLGLHNESALFAWVGVIVRRTLSNIPTSAYDFEDMTAIGLLTLSEAVKAYDPEREDTFKAYAIIRIRGAVIDEIRRVIRRLPISESLALEEEKTVEERLVCFRTPLEEALKNELRRKLTAEVNKLPEMERSVILDFSVLDKKNIEIALSHGKATRSFATKVIQRVAEKLRGPLVAAGITGTLEVA